MKIEDKLLVREIHQQNRQVFEALVIPLGGQFFLQEDSSIYTTLVEGAVSLFSEKNPQIQQSLVPEQQSVLVRGRNQLSQRRVDPEQYVAWKHGWFHFQNEPLESIMQTLARWYDVKVQFQSDAAKKITFTGKVKRYEDLQEILNLLEKTNEVTFKTERRYITVNLKK